MILKEYFQKRRSQMFPGITDWSDPMNHIRFDQNVRAMKYNDWFWFHPTAYSLIHFGYPLLSCVMFLGTMALTWKIPAVPVFAGLIAGVFLFDFARKFRKRREVSMITMHDVYLRD